MAWQPLESNPDVMNKFIHSVGVPDNWEISDVYGLDPELLALVPKPVLAVILLFPCSETYEKHKEEEATRLISEPQQISDKLFYMKQTIHNACGTIALFHSIANCEEQIRLRDGQLKKFLDEARPLTPAERGQLLEDTMDLATVHRGVAQEGQTEESPGEDQWPQAPRCPSSADSQSPSQPSSKRIDEERGSVPDNPNECASSSHDIGGSTSSGENGGNVDSDNKAPPADANIIHHFVAFIHKDGVLYEMDGRKSGPINHGPTTADTLLEDAAEVCKKFMNRDPEDLRFTVMALTAASP